MFNCSLQDIYVPASNWVSKKPRHALTDGTFGELIISSAFQDTKVQINPKVKR